MSMRLQVVMSEEEYGEIRAAAQRRRLNVSEWVRSVLRAARERDARAAPPAVRESGPDYGAGRTPGAERVRLEVDVREDLIDAVLERYHLSSARAAVEYALSRAAVRPMSKDEALSMEGAGWEGDLDALRSGDPGKAW
jgi:Arc/MetJ family transcription regulator